MTVDAWVMAAECARAVEVCENPTRCAVLRALQKLWIELGEKERLLSEQEVLKEMEDLHALHAQLLGPQSSAPYTRHATGAVGRHNPAFERDAAKARDVIGPSCDLTDPERQSAPPRPAQV
jgi:hypothetical protein